MAATTRTIIATGGHSGLGLVALEKLLSSAFVSDAECNLILYARDPTASHCQAARKQLSRSNVQVDLRQMDLASLPSVRKAAETLRNELQADQSKVVDLLLMNAAVAKSSRVLVDDSQHKPGQGDALADQQGRYEMTACVNHVAHLLFLTHLSPVIRRQSKTRIVFTGSALHRRLKEVESLDTWFSGHGAATAWDLRETYAASKFLQMLGIRAYRRKLEQEIKDASSDAKAEVVVVQPGFVPQTGLSRETGLVGKLAMNYLLPLMPFATGLQQAGEYIARACYVDLEEQGAPEQDGWGVTHTGVSAALLQKAGAEQEFAKPDPRTGDVSLQSKWWPTVCDERV